MKLQLRTLLFLMLFLVSFCFVSAQEDITIVTQSSDIAKSLDLKTVGELFKDSANLEEFEKSLNDSNVGINNLDLDENGKVDYIRVVEEVADDTHVIILQVPLEEDEYQDVATIEVEKNENGEYNMQVHGNELIYGANYYITPTYTRINTWPIITWIYRPLYRPYRSVYYYGYYPRWWKAYRPVNVSLYRTKTLRLYKRPSFVISKTSRVRSAVKVNYKIRSSTRVKKTVLKRKARKTTLKKNVGTKKAKVVKKKPVKKKKKK